MTEAIKTADAAPQTPLDRAQQKRQDIKSEMNWDIGFGLVGLGVAAAATAFMPGLLVTAGIIFAALKGWDVIEDAGRIMSIDKGIKQLNEGKTDDLRKRDKSLKGWNRGLKGLALFAAGGILTLAISTIAAPALLPIAAAAQLISAIALPAVGLLTVSSALDGFSKGAHDVVKAIDPPAPKVAEAKPAPAGAENAPGRFKKLGASIMSVFKSKAAPAAAEAPKAPAPAPEIKPAAPAVPA